MKRLFILREFKKGPVIPGLFFQNKMVAKQYRNKIRVKYPDAVVSIGPDHKLYEQGES